MGGAQEVDAPRAGLPLSAATEQRVVALLLARLALSLSSFGILLLLDGIGVGPTLSESERAGLYWTLAFAFSATIVSAVLLQRRRAAPNFAALQIAADVGIVSSLVHFSGGHQSVFSFLYVAVTAYGAVLFERRQAIVAATASALAYAGVLGFEQLGWGVATRSAHFAVAVATWGVHVAALFLVAALASALSSELRRTGAALDRSALDLRRLRDLNARIVESLNSGLLTTDASGRIGSFNPEAERITAMRASEAVGVGVDDVIPGAWAIVRLARDEGVDRVRRARLAHRASDGAMRFLGLAASALRDEHGASIGHVVIFQDVTDVVEMEARLTRSERLAAVGEMAAKIAHEVRNPLAAISGSVQILSKDVGDPAAPDPSRLMEIVVREADRLSGLITDFLDYARPKPVRRERVDLGELVADVVEMVATAAPPHVEVQVSVDDGDVHASCDADQLRQVVWNLCRNAIEAMVDAGVVRLSIARGAAPSQERAAGGRSMALGVRTGVRLEIEDEGSGIDASTRSRLFEPFFTTKRGGTGLGLAMVHRIVEAHGGEIEVEARAERGTRFVVWLPAEGGDAGPIPIEGTA